MITELIKKRVRNPGLSRYPKAVNLYKFIRLILGVQIPDRQIARRWKMDGKNFSQLKNGKSAAPRLERLEQLARVLGINKHLVFEVAGGASADKVFRLIKKNDLPGQIKLVFGNLGALLTCHLCGRVLDLKK